MNVCVCGRGCVKEWREVEQEGDEMRRRRGEGLSVEQRRVSLQAVAPRRSSS
jgi:hypothetical protein